MNFSPIVCDDEDAGRALAAQLGRSGLQTRVLSPLEAWALDGASHFIVADRAGVPVSRAWGGLVSPESRKQTITSSFYLSARDIVALDDLGIKYCCNTGRGIDSLLRLVGIVDAGVISSSKVRLVQARETAQSVFQATTAAFGLFQGAEAYDTAFYETLGLEFAERINLAPVSLLIEAISSQQDTTIQHCSLVTVIAMAFGSSLGLPSSEIERLFLAAFFHDIGKSVIPKGIIDKPGRLTPEETQLIRSHVAVGYDMLRRFPETEGEVADVALLHHEMLDGSGYPHGLKGSEIPDLVRIVTICDVFAALIERRAYKAPMAASDAFGILQSMGGKLDQDLVGLFGQKVALSF